jgi:molybdopterin/thiamine biosynthesis adenylyltransferase
MNIYQIPPSFSVTLIGAGGIGATTALALAKMGVKHIVVWDDDFVSDENIPTQLHRVSDVGDAKVVGLHETLFTYADSLTVELFQDRVGPSASLRSSLVVSAVDSITARQEIWKALRNENSATWHYLDARMAAEEYQHFLIDMQDSRAVQSYEDKLMAMDENSAPDLPCTGKATFYTAMLAAGHVGTQVRNIVRGEAKSHRLVHDIPASWLETFPV